MSVGTDGRWEAGIGDPTLIGWITVAAYGAAALLSLRCARRVPLGREHLFWAFSSLALLLLGINKQLDLQSLFTQIGRDLAVSQGWYAQRGLVQEAFIAILALVALVTAWGLTRLLRGFETAARVAAVGLVGIMAFVLIRATSFHHVDQLLGLDFAGLRINWLLELAPLVLFGWGALRRLRSTGLGGEKAVGKSYSRRDSSARSRRKY